MSINMKDCLQLPSFQGSEVISGESALNHPVNNISVLEITNEAQLQYVKDNLNSFEIYLTSFSGIAYNVQAQCELIEDLANTGNVSLVLYYVGTVVEELHPDVIATARVLNLPLILMPEGRIDLQYSDPIHEVSDLLLEAQNRQDEEYKNLAVMLSKVPESSRNFDMLLKTISELKKVNLLLSDVSYLNTLQSSYFTSKPIDYCTIIDIFNQTYADNNDHMLESEFEGNKINIFRIKLESHKFRYYYLYILDSSNNITLSEAKQMAELVQLFSEIWNLSEDEISSQSILNALDENNIEKLKALSKRYDLSLDKTGTLYLININLSDSDHYNTVKERIELKESIKSIVNKSHHYIFFNTYGKYFVLYMREVHDELTRAEFMSSLLKVLDGCKASITQVNASLKEVRGILPLYDCYFNDMEKIFPKQTVYALTDIFFASTCRRILELNGPDKTIFDSLLQKIKSHADADDLLDTLSAFYLDTDCQINLTAEQLYIHRNTVKYRLKKAETFLQIPSGHAKNASFIKVLMGYYRLLA